MSQEFDSNVIDVSKKVFFLMIIGIVLKSLKKNYQALTRFDQ